MSTTRTRRIAGGAVAVVAAGLVAVAVGACSSDRKATPSTSTTPGIDPSKVRNVGAASDAVTTLQRVIDATVAAAPNVPGIVVHIDNPARGIDVTVAGGRADRASGAPLATDATFRIASNTKTYTSAAVLRLVEQGHVRVDDPIAAYLAPESTAALRAGGYDPERITVRQVLTHTSGLYDFAEDEAYQAAVFAEPAKQWTRLEQVRWAMEHGTPTGAPGERYGYSDTGYVLLGELIERASGLDLARAYRTLLRFDALGLDETYLETLEPTPAAAGDRMHQYLGDADSYGLHPSFDLYGGGGFVSTVDEMAAFYAALVGGKVFDDPRTLAMMQEVPAVNEATGDAMGIVRQNLAGHECWGHDGFWGTSVTTCPDLGITVASSASQAEVFETVDREPMLVAALRVAGFNP